MSSSIYLVILKNRVYILGKENYLINDNESFLVKTLFNCIYMILDRLDLARFSNPFWRSGLWPF